MNKSEKTKSKILKEAKKLFWNYGYSNVSVRQIAKAAKVDAAQTAWDNDNVGFI